MVDREKVIRGLEYCIASRTDSVSCRECPYYRTGSDCWQVERDALELLKEQEPVEPTKQHIEKPKVDLWYCGECGKWIGKTFAYCQWCGKAVKWDDVNI